MTQILQSISFKERNLNVQIIFLFVIMYRKYLMSKIQYKCQIICMWFTWIWNFSMGKKRTKTLNKQWKHKHKLSLKKLFKQSNCQSSTCLQSNWFYALNLILIKANTGNLTDVEVEMERISRSQTGYEYNLDKTTQRSRWRLDEGIKLELGNIMWLFIASRMMNRKVVFRTLTISRIGLFRFTLGISISHLSPHYFRIMCLLCPCPLPFTI